MARHVLLVEQSAGSPLESAVPAGWRLTRIAEGPLALAWLKRAPVDLLLLGATLADLTPAEFVRAVRLDHAASLIPLAQLGPPVPVTSLCAEPDAWIDLACPSCAVEAALEAGETRRRDGTRAEVSLRLPSQLDQLQDLSDALAAWLTECGFGAQMRNHLGLAVREIAANAIEWGHGLDRTRSVLVQLCLDEEKVSVLVSDTGPGFNPRHLPHAARPGDPLSHLDVRASLSLREGGFGILMARGLVDHLCYNEAGNEVQLLKYLPARKHLAALVH